jgi:integrase/ribosomal protein L37AE/L43A
MAELTQQTSAANRRFGKEAGSKNSESERVRGSAGASPLCPQCGSNKLWRDGLRYSPFGDKIQRWLCRNCGFRFSDSHDVERSWSAFERLQRVQTKSLKAKVDIVSDRQICVSEGEMINLAEVTRQETAAGATLLDKATLKGLLVQYAFWIQKEGYAEDSRYRDCIRMLINAGANLRDPENVKAVIAKRPWKDGTKMQATYAYDLMTKMLGITWTKPRYRQEETLPFVPEEKELNDLVASCKSRRMAAFLQTLKETYADPTEALRLRWIDIDFSKSIITINKPVKGHLPGQIKVSSNVLAMLNALPKTSERIFPITYKSAYDCFKQVRKRAAARLQNPRLLAISFRTYRHWGGTMIAHYTNGNVLTVKKLLRHKRIDNTMKYIHMITFKDDEFEVGSATTVEEAKKLLSVGFDYITQKDNIMLFRRPKRFSILGT